MTEPTEPTPHIEYEPVEIDYANRSIGNIDPPPSRAPKLDPPRSMTSQDKMELRAAAFRATRVLPPGIGGIVSRELLAWEEFGYMYGKGPDAVIHRVIQEVMALPMPEVKPHLTTDPATISDQKAG